MPPETPSNPASETLPEPADPASLGLAFVTGDAPEYARVPRHIQLANISLVWGCVGLIMGAVSALRLLLSFVLVPPLGVMLLISGAAILTTLVLLRRPFARYFTETSAIPEKPPADPEARSRRVRVLLHPSRALELWRSLGEGRFGFEPEIARVPLAVGVDPGARRLAWLGGVLGCLAAILAELLVHRPMAELSISIWFVMGMTALGAVGLPEFVFPTYVRVIPGRLDVIRAPIFGPGMRTVLSVDLRTRPLFIAGSTIFAEPVREPGTPLPPKIWGKKWHQGMVHPPEASPDAVCLILTPARRTILRAVLWGATTEAETPDLPGDRLIG